MWWGLMTCSRTSSLKLCIDTVHTASHHHQQDQHHETELLQIHCLRYETDGCNKYRPHMKFCLLMTCRFYGAPTVARYPVHLVSSRRRDSSVLVEIVEIGWVKVTVNQLSHVSHLYGRGLCRCYVTQADQSGRRLRYHIKMACVLKLKCM